MQGIADKHPCTSICEYQYKKISKAPEDSDSKQEFSKAMFHMPEPWNGNLKTAEILFVSSNPSIDLKEDFPKFESEEWSEDKKDGVVDFFSKRLKRYKNNYWTGIRKYTAWILEVTDPFWALDKENEEDKIREIASRVALTEIVHCKSKREAGVKKAAKMCFDTHTEKVIEYFLKAPSRSGKKKTVVFVGAQARNRLCELGDINPKNATRDQVAEFCTKKFREYNQNARFLFMPHPGGNRWIWWNSGKPGLRDEDRQKLIYEQLQQYV